MMTAKLASKWKLTFVNSCFNNSEEDSGADDDVLASSALALGGVGGLSDLTWNIQNIFKHKKNCTEDEFEELNEIHC